MCKKTKKIIIWTSIILLTIFSIYLYIKLMQVNSLQVLKKWFEPSLKGYLIYTFIVIIQILIIPISTMVLIVPALMIYGPSITFILTLISVTIGSVITYYVGFFASDWANSLIKKNKTFNKWNQELQRNGKILLPYFCIIPIFPDEIICIMSGISKINIWYYTIVTILTRGLHLIFICFLGAIVPMHGWWLLLWLFLLIILTFFCFYLTKKQNNIKLWIISKFGK